MPDSLSAAAARRIALAAQGFSRPRPASVGTRQLNLAVQRLGLLQLDSVNVFERSHYLPLLARLGPYDTDLLDRLVFDRRGGYREAWAHEAAVIPLADWPLFGFRRERMRARVERLHPGWYDANRPLLDELKAELAARGPLPASKIEHPSRARRGGWWEWDAVKLGLERMFIAGEVVSGGRTSFERVYALPSQTIPAEIAAVSMPVEEQILRLVERSAERLGVGTVADHADYYRLPQAETKAAVLRLVDEGVLHPVRVGTGDDGWDRPAFLHRDARIPRRIDAAAFLSPFDPVVWHRDRALRMFDFHYRIEIYTPAEKRLYGYYSLPILIDDRVVGRIDLKNDRQAKVLRVQSAWREEHAPPAGVLVERMLPVLHEIAAWQGHGGIAVADWGDLARPLAAALGVGLGGVVSTSSTTGNG